MVFIANTKDYLFIEGINNFSCSDLKKIDEYWIQNSGGRFSFSVQKKIWDDTGNRLSITELKKSDIENYLRFAYHIGWYDDLDTKDFSNYNQVIEQAEKNNRVVPLGILQMGYHSYVMRVGAVRAEFFFRAATCKL